MLLRTAHKCFEKAGLANISGQSEYVGGSRAEPACGRLQRGTISSTQRHPGPVLEENFRHAEPDALAAGSDESNFTVKTDRHRDLAETAV